MRNQKSVAIYCRVSTNDQDTGSQETELRRYVQQREWAIFKIYRDRGYSGATTNRPALQELLSDARRRRFDVILVFRFDRLARSLKELIDTLELCRSLKICFVSAGEGIDTGSAGGELAFQIFGAVGQFERSLIAERVKAGVRHAREQEKQIGRRAERVLSKAEQQVVLRERRQKRTSLRALAQKHKVSAWQISKLLAQKAGV